VTCGETYAGILRNAGFGRTIAFQFDTNFGDTFTNRFSNSSDRRGLFIVAGVGHRHSIPGLCISFLIL